MKILGYLLITAGFLAGAFVAVQQAEGVPVPAFLGAFAVGIVGVALARIATHKEARRGDVVATNLEAIGGSLDSVVAKIAKLDAEKESIDVYELRHIIDRDFPDDLDRFVQARQSIAHTHGLQPYADVMNPFAAGERYLNRVWSTSTDGYIDEAHAYLTKAHEQFEQAAAIFKSLGTPRPT